VPRASTRQDAHRAPAQLDLGTVSDHALAVLGELAQAEVELKRSEGHALGRFAGLDRPAAAQHALDAQQQLARLERLAEIVVDALLEAAMRSLGSPMAVSIRMGTALVLRSSPANSRPVLARHHHVEHDQVEVERFELLVRRGRVAGRAEP